MTKFLLDKNEILKLIRIGIEYEREMTQDTESDTPDRLFSEIKNKLYQFNITNEELDKTLR